MTDKHSFFPASALHVRAVACLILALAVAAGFGVNPAWAQDGGTVSFHGQEPSADDIIKGLLPDQPDSGMPEGLLPTPGGATGAVKQRGIAIKPKDGAEVPGGAEAGLQQSLPCPNETRKIAVDVTFKLGSAALDAHAHNTLNQIAIAMNAPQFRNCRFDVVGHTDASGSPTANQILSEKRAASVLDYLLKLKIGPERLKPSGKGQSALLNQADPLAAENRRVEFSVISPSQGY